MEDHLSTVKGVVPQPNDRQRDQIYEKHQRVRLGIFIRELEAAKAYDIAAQIFRGRDMMIFDMLRKHTHNDELDQIESNFSDGSSHRGINRSGIYMGLTTRSMGQVMGAREQLGNATCREELPFANRNYLQSKENRYSYWNNSQNYVLTKGCSSRFVREKGLKDKHLQKVYAVSGLVESSNQNHSWIRNKKKERSGLITDNRLS
ncbi:hypothetical protein MKW94_030082 [Papaver nudicaule]|uniref:AP2/ERF domain-containing protein n=1 Tax=Papaver nudicaule TaxID=74823 RepID=A0AA41RM21_PAPNU|nr:hypothetical protein [Papaver nudicaule]